MGKYTIKRLTTYNMFIKREIARLKALPEYADMSNKDIFRRAAHSWSVYKKRIEGNNAHIDNQKPGENITYNQYFISQEIARLKALPEYTHETDKGIFAQASEHWSEFKATISAVDKPTGLTGYNIFMRYEIMRLKALPQYDGMMHRDIFRLAAKNWSTFKGHC